jgi:hypothetical protein
MLTDYVLTAGCVYWAIRLRAHRRSALWRAAFLVTGFAALAGGTAHGFRVPLGESWESLWRVTVTSIAASSALLIAAGLRSGLGPATRDADRRRLGIRWLLGAVGITIVALGALLARVSPHVHFNQNDLYHLIQMAGLYALYRGAQCLHDRKGEAGERSLLGAESP